MRSPQGPSWASRILWSAGLVAITCAMVLVCRSAIAPERVAPDYIQFWTAATLLSQGLNPYDVTLQASIQHDLGWNRAAEGVGLYDFLPYYYPPWLGLACLPLLALGYPLAKLTWMVLGGEMLVGAGLLLRHRVRSIPPLVTVVVVCLFGFSVRAVVMGQVAPLVLLLIAASWTLLEERRDLAAGCVLALAAFKPQLTGLLLMAVLLWCARQQRWSVLAAFATTLGALALVSTLVFPGWVPAMLAATRITPVPTAYFLGLGATWMTVLRAVGAGGLLLWAGYLALALPLLALLVSLAIKPATALEDLLGVSLMAAFFLAPYGRSYDFPLLLIPALILMGSRLSEMSKGLMVATLVLLPTLHILWQTINYQPQDVAVRQSEFTYFWIPLLIAGIWFGTAARPSGGSGELR